MDDLISRSALLEELQESKKHHAQNQRELTLLNRAECIVKAQPTAYNVDKVVEEITEKSYGIQLDGALVASDKTIVELKDAVNVVKAGGVNG